MKNSYSSIINSYIEKLKEMGVNTIYLTENESEKDVITKEIISVTSVVQKIRKEIKLCDEVGDNSRKMKEKIKEKREKEQEKIKNKEKQKNKNKKKDRSR